MTKGYFLSQLVLLIISFALPVIATFATNYLRAKIGNEKLKKYAYLAETAVKAAETTWKGTNQGTYKKEDVVDYLTSKLSGSGLTALDIDKLIQAAVFELGKVKNNIMFGDTCSAPSTYPFQPAAIYRTPTAAPDIPSPDPKEGLL